MGVAIFPALTFAHFAHIYTSSCQAVQEIDPGDICLVRVYFFIDVQSTGVKVDTSVGNC